MTSGDWYTLVYAIGFLCTILVWNRRRIRRAKERRQARSQRKALERLDESGSTNGR